MGHAAWNLCLCFPVACLQPDPNLPSSVIQKSILSLNPEIFYWSSVSIESPKFGSLRFWDGQTADSTGVLLKWNLSAALVASSKIPPHIKSEVKLYLKTTHRSTHICIYHTHPTTVGETGRGSMTMPECMETTEFQLFTERFLKGFG